MPNGSYMKRFEDQIDWYDGKATWNHDRYRRFQASAVVLSGLTPLLLAVNLLFVGIENRWDQYLLTLLPIIVSVGATVSVALLTTFKYREKWTQYRDTCERLRREQALFEANAGDYTRSRSPERLLAERAEGIMAGENTSWLTTICGADQEESAS